jgi:hypothetical protein
MRLKSRDRPVEISPAHAGSADAAVPRHIHCLQTEDGGFIKRFGHDLYGALQPQSVPVCYTILAPEPRLTASAILPHRRAWL